MIIPVEFDHEAESTLRTEAKRLEIEPRELARQSLQIAIRNHARLNAGLSGRQAATAPRGGGEVDGILKSVFPDGFRNLNGAAILTFGMFRGQLGDLTRDDFSGAEFRDQGELID
jgi:hypothetical protein